MDGCGLCGRGCWGTRSLVHYSCAVQPTGYGSGVLATATVRRTSSPSSTAPRDGLEVRRTEDL